MKHPKARMDQAAELLPSLTSPTVSALSDPAWLSVEIVVDESIVRDLIPELKPWVRKASSNTR
jgi:ATP phosphoribosyltransferase